MEAIESLANTTVQNQATVQALTATNVKITQNLMEDNKQLAEALAIITALQVARGALAFGGRGGGRGRGAGHGADQGGRGGRGHCEYRGGMCCTVRLYNNQNYRHTYGYNIYDDHVSNTYNTPVIGYCHDATLQTIKAVRRSIVN